MLVTISGFLRVVQGQATGHPQMDEQVLTTGKLEDDVFTPARDAVYPTTYNERDKTRRCRRFDRAAPADSYARDFAPWYTKFAEITNDSLDLW